MNNTVLVCLALGVSLSVVVLWFMLSKKPKAQRPVWLARERVERWNEDPLVLVYPQFLTRDECEYLIRLAEPRLSQSTVQTHTLEKSPDRTSYSTHLDKGGCPIVRRIEERALDLAQVPYANLEPLQVVRYQPSQFYKPHYDYFVPGAKGTVEALKRGGQRTLTLFVYLNDLPEDEKGGRTVFPKLGIKIPPRAGAAVMFYNVKDDGQVDDRVLHGGEPPQHATKWGLNLWFRERAFH